jgi:signal transduction histidine kinase
VFRNLLENAIGFCRERVAVIAAETELEGAPAVSVVINDDGPGLPADQRPRLFQPFFTTKTHGTGLGLAIVKRILEAHGGRVELTTGPLRGAAFALAVPRR